MITHPSASVHRVRLEPRASHLFRISPARGQFLMCCSFAQLYEDGGCRRYARIPPTILHLLTSPEADAIRILVATDNHVGFEERDPIRKDDSWQTFDECMNIAREEDARPLFRFSLCLAD